MELRRFVLTEIELKVAGRKKELLDRLLPFASDNNLLEKRLKQVKRFVVFQTSMDPTEIPAPSSVWSTDQSLFPQVGATTIIQWIQKQGRKRQYCKAQIIFNSWKIKTVKVHQYGEVV